MSDNIVMNDSIVVNDAILGDKSNVTNRVIAYILKNIQENNWKEGSKLPSEHTLCAELGVSRITVRRAIQQFNSIGITRSVQGKGTFLLTDDLTPFLPQEQEEKEEKPFGYLDDLKDLLEFRRLVEPQICEKAAENPSPELIEKLTKLNEQMRHAVGDSESFVKADIAFHMAIIETTGNPITIGIMQEVADKKNKSYLELNHTVGYYGGMYYHELILEAIKMHNTKKAREYMKEHLVHSVEDLKLKRGEN